MIFVDTSALLPLIVVDDADHAAVRGALADLHHEELMTHEYVLVESVSLLQARHGLAAVRLFADDVLPAIDVRSVSQRLRESAINALLTAGRRQVSLVDWTSFLFMREHGIDTAVALDPDFAREGFTVVPG